LKLIAKRLQNDCEAIKSDEVVIKMYFESNGNAKALSGDYTAIPERLQMDCKAMAEGLQSDSKTTAKRLLSERKANTKLKESD
jgi:hypothetical protein